MIARQLLVLSLLAILLPTIGSAADAMPSREQIMKHLEQMRATQKGMWNVAPAEGQHLADLVRKLNAQQVLEIGTSNGYSAIWLATGLKDTGGRLITIDIDRGRSRLAQENFRATGFNELIDSRLGNALNEIPKLTGPFDLVFLDAAKHEYLRYLELVLPKVPSGGVIVAHNVVDLADQLPEFLKVIQDHPRLRTEMVRVGPGGLSISYKK